MKQLPSLLLLLAILLVFPINLFAWGNKGHAIVAEIAFHYLDENTKKNVLNYLDGMSIEDAANWMDKMRSNHAYDYMKPYHYADYEKGENITDNNPNNIIGVLNTSLKALDNEKNLSQAEIKTRLLYLFHLIGDLHQPLHVGYSIDKGGNDIQISFSGRGTNLHKVWDTDIIEDKNISLEDCLKLNNYSPQELKKNQKIDILAWANESRKYLPNVYDFNGHKIGEQYIDANDQIIERQLLDAGIRLAAILRHYFGDKVQLPRK